MLDALTEGWKNEQEGWGKVSARMRGIPAVQLSALRAVRQKLDEGRALPEN